MLFPKFKMNILIILSIFLIPLASIIPIKGTIVWYPQLLALLAFGLIFISLKFWKFNKFISLILIYESFSYLFVTGQSPRTMICLLTGFSAMALAFVVSKVKDTKIIINCIIAMAIFQSLYVILQHFNIDFFFHGANGNPDVVGFVGSHNQLGAYCSAVGVILTALNPILIIFSIIPIFLAKQNGAIIGLVISTLLYVYLIYSKKLAFILILSAFLLSFIWIAKCGKSHEEISERLSLWQQTIKQSLSGKTVMDISPIKQFNLNKSYPQNIRVVESNPIFGYGLGNFFVYSPHSQYTFLTGLGQGHRYEHAHNDLIEALYELGYFGFTLILLAIYNVISTFILVEKKSKELILIFCALLGLSLTSLSIYVFHAPVSLFMFSLLLGIFYNEINKSKIKTIF